MDVAASTNSTSGELSNARAWATLGLGGLAGWSTFWAAFWLVHLIGEHNDDSAADEEFGLAAAASFAVAIGVTAWASSVAAGWRAPLWWPAVWWVCGFIAGALFLAIYVAQVAGSSVEG